MAKSNRNTKNNTVSTPNKEEEEPSFSLSQVKEMLKAQESTFLSFFTASLEQMDKKIESLRERYDKDILELKSSMTFNGDTLCDFKKGVSETLEKRNFEHNEFIHYVEQRFAGQEDRDRRNNLRFENVPEPEQFESWEECEQKVKETIRILGIPADSIKIERAHRVGNRRIPGRKRVILAKFSNYKDKDAVLKAYRQKKHWEKRETYINEDFSDFTMNIRKRLFAEAKELRSKGEYAKVVYNRIIRKPKRDGRIEETKD